MFEGKKPEPQLRRHRRRRQSERCRLPEAKRRENGQEEEEPGAPESWDTDGVTREWAQGWRDRVSVRSPQLTGAQRLRASAEAGKQKVVPVSLSPTHSESTTLSGDPESAQATGLWELSRL